MSWLQQICPAPGCGMPIYEYAKESTPEVLDLFCPNCGEHVAHFTRSALEELRDSEDSR